MSNNFCFCGKSLKKIRVHFLWCDKSSKNRYLKLEFELDPDMEHCTLWRGIGGLSRMGRVKHKCLYCNSLRRNDSSHTASHRLIYGSSDSICIISAASIIAFNCQPRRLLCMRSLHLHILADETDEIIATGAAVESSALFLICLRENCIHFRGLRDRESVCHHQG